MRALRWSVFVEGESDSTFVKSLLHHLSILSVDLEEIGGGISKLKRIRQQIQRRYDQGRSVAVILDADSDVVQRRQDLAQTIRELSLPISRSFLLPDDHGPGSLETLLQELATDDHRAVHGCFEAYKDCLEDLSPRYTLPDMKAKIFAYCDACPGVGPKNEERNYGNAQVWNLRAPVVEPLKGFLRGLVTE